MLLPTKLRPPLRVPQVPVPARLRNSASHHSRERSFGSCSLFSLTLVWQHAKEVGGRVTKSRLWEATMAHAGEAYCMYSKQDNAE
jgi:hypothetical protein